MKIVVIGDIHGETLWVDILNKEDADRYIFLGDYWDSFHVPFHDQRDNYHSIAALKAVFPDKYILLFGNHDYHYIDDKDEYSGYQWKFESYIKELLLDDIDLFQAAHMEGKFLFTHAGVTKTWMSEYGLSEWNQINDLFITDKKAFRFFRGDYAGYGDHIMQGPFWVRPKSLKEDAFEGVTHVVGHTQQKNLLITDNAIFADTIQSREYLVIEDERPEIRTI